VRSRLLLLGGQTTALGLTTAFLVVPVSAIFLDEYGARLLPYVYLAVAVAGVVVSWTMSRAEHRLTLARLAQTVLATYLVLVAAGWAALVLADRPWATFPLLVLFPLSIPIGFVLVGAQAGRLLDVRELKAHFPRVAAGFPVGFALGGLAAAGLVGPFGGPVHLLGLDLASTLLMLGLVVLTARSYPAELRGPPADKARVMTEVVRRAPVRSLLGNRLVALVLAYQVLSAAVTQLIDFMVWERAAARFPDPSSLAQFQGLFGAVINVVSVAFVLVLGGWLMTRFGVGFGLAANPVGVLVLLVLTSLVGYSVGPVALVFFVLVCAQQVTDIALTDGTTRTSINATYQALPADLRVRAQTTVEGAGIPLAMGFVGVVLIGYDAVGLDVRSVAVLTLLLSVAWLAVSLLVFREYGANLRSVLSRRVWDPVALRLDDAPSSLAVRHLLESEDPGDVRSALDAMTDAGQDVAEPARRLLGDPDPARRRLAVEVVVGAGLLSDPEVATEVHALLVDEDAGVAVTAAAALVRLGGALRPWREDGRAAWLTALGDDDPAVTAAPLRAASAMPHRFFVPYLVGMASSARASADVLDALAAHADHLAPHVHGLLSDPAVPRPTRERLVHVLGSADTPEARDLLVAHLDDADPTVVEAAARCLVTVGHTESAERLELGPRILSLVERSERCLQILLLLDDRAAHEPLRIALHDELGAAARRTEVLLDLVYDARAIGMAVSELGSPASRDRSSALEMLEVTIGRTLAPTVVAMLDPLLTDATRHSALAGRVDVPPRELAGWLRELVVDPARTWDDPWLRACALYATAGSLPALEARDLATPYLHDPEPDVRETARWVVARWFPPQRTGASAVPG